MATVLAPDSLGPTVCVGEILVEIVATTVGDGFLKAQPLVGPFASGAPAIFISQCGRLGGKAALVGAVGDDDFGRVNTDRLKRDGVDISTIAIDPDYPTGSAFVRYRKDGYSLQVGMQNIFDKEYFVGTLPTTVGSPRLVTGGIRVRFAGRPTP